MKQYEDPKTKMQLTEQQKKEIMSYQQHWRPTLTKAAERGESIKKTYEELKGLEGLM